MDVLRRWWLVVDPEDGHAYAVENTRDDADTEAATLGSVGVVEVEPAAPRGAVDRDATYRCPTCVGTGSMESSDSTDDRWWDCSRCKGTGKLADRRRQRGAVDPHEHDSLYAAWAEAERETIRLRNAAARALERCEVADDPSGAADEAAAILREVVNLDGLPAERGVVAPELTDEAVVHAERALYDRWAAEGETTTKEDVRTIVHALAEVASPVCGVIFGYPSDEHVCDRVAEHESYDKAHAGPLRGSQTGRRLTARPGAVSDERCEACERVVTDERDRVVDRQEGVTICLRCAYEMAVHEVASLRNAKKVVSDVAPALAEVEKAQLRGAVPAWVVRDLRGLLGKEL